MKIGIYGDSFACINTKWDSSFMKSLQNFGGAGIGDAGKSWVEILEEEHEITNFAVMGTAFMFSYEIFLKEHKKFDLNIFVVTSPLRIYIKELDGLRIFGAWDQAEYNRITRLPFYKKQQTHLDILKSVKTYIEIWADFEMITHTQHVLVKNLWNLSPNTLVISGFSDSIEESTVGLNELAMYELNLVNKKEVDPRFRCLRKCHFSKENNNMLSKKVKDAIEKQEKILQLSLADVVTPSNINLDFYIKKQKYDSLSGAWI